MKLLSFKELSDKREAERLRDIEKTKLVKEEYFRVSGMLSEINAKFELALQNQRIRWAQAEEDHIKKIEDLTKEVSALENKIKTLTVPIEEREKKSYDLLAEAEKRLNEALEKDKYNEELTKLLEEKIDSVHEWETSLQEREKIIEFKEKANEDQRQIIKNLSADLTNKITRL